MVNNTFVDNIAESSITLYHQILNSANPQNALRRTLESAVRISFVNGRMTGQLEQKHYYESNYILIPKHFIPIPEGQKCNTN